MTKPNPAVWSIIPDGGDHVPSALLAVINPAPPDPDIQSPERMHEKTARPTASCNILGGIFFVTDFVVGGVSVFGSCSCGSSTRKPSTVWVEAGLAYVHESIGSGTTDNVLQKDFNILAALSHSLSRVVGQYVSRS